MGTIIERKNKKGKAVYVASVRRKGLPRAYRSFSRLTDAREWIQELEYKARTGQGATLTESARHTLSDAIQRYFLEDIPKKLANRRDHERQLCWFGGHIGSKRLGEITPALLTEIKGMFLREISRNQRRRQPQTWNRYISALSSVFEVCVKDWQWLEVNPARRVRREREAPGRTRFLSDEERERLLEACRNARSPNLYPLVVLALSTGMRFSEMRWLTWQQIDLGQGTIILTKTKNKEPRRVPVRRAALALLREHAKVRRIDCDFVFPGAKTRETSRPFCVDRHWRKAVKEAKLENFRFHDIRHCTGSYLAMNGATLLEIAEVLGHKTLEMVKRYSHLAESHIGAVVDRMNEKIFG